MNPIASYACCSLESQVLDYSSSGGVFYHLADKILSLNGIVYGVSMSTDCYSAEYLKISSSADLKKIMGSKYIQANVRDTFKNVKESLDDGRYVLFSGTTCYVNGLLNYLGRTYERLLTVDLVCHGVPSQAVWKEYLQDEERTKKKKCEQVNFRCKKYSWKNFGICINEKFEFKEDNSYFQLFLKNYILRPSCYNCIVRNNKKADITIGDLWGAEYIVPEMDSRRGISWAIIRTEKGLDYFSNIKGQLEVKSIRYEEARKYNSAESDSVSEPIQRTEFFNDFVHNISYVNLKKKYAIPQKVPCITIIKRYIKTLMGG